MAQWVYWLLIPFIFAGEIYINAFAFDVLGAVPENMKYAVAGAISLAVVVCSHAVGMLLKTGDITSRERTILKAAFFSRSSSSSGSRSCASWRFSSSTRAPVSASL